jgi:hypothetical protein
LKPAHAELSHVVMVGLDELLRDGLTAYPLLIGPFDDLVIDIREVLHKLTA